MLNIGLRGSVTVYGCRRDEFIGEFEESLDLIVAGGVGNGLGASGRWFCGFFREESGDFLEF